MLTLVNVTASIIVLCASIWALLTPRLPIRTGGSMLLAFVAFAFFGDIATPDACHSLPEVLVNVSVACIALGLLWRVEIRRLFIHDRRQTYL